MVCRPLCVYCRQRPIEAPWAPFCSQRCKDVDLGRWLNGDYRIPAGRPEPTLSPDEAETPGEAGSSEPLEEDQG